MLQNPIAIAGVDGCGGGWLVAAGLMAQERIEDVRLSVCPTFSAALLHVSPDALISVDIPMGLPDVRERGGRECERLARKVLGRGRTSCAFPTPIRSVLHETEYDAVRIHGVSRQTFGTLPKIREVDGHLTPKLQERVVESHPEIVFCAMAGRAAPPKQTAEGYAARLELLRRCRPPFARDPGELAAETRRAFLKKAVKDDGIPDALALLWLSAKRALGEAETLPPSPPIDRRGLRMEMWTATMNS